jgi:hypothetical protein
VEEVQEEDEEDKEEEKQKEEEKEDHEEEDEKKETGVHERRRRRSRMEERGKGGRMRRKKDKEEAENRGESKKLQLTSNRRQRPQPPRPRTHVCSGRTVGHHHDVPLWPRPQPGQALVAPLRAIRLRRHAHKRTPNNRLYCILSCTCLICYGGPPAHAPIPRTTTQVRNNTRIVQVEGRLRGGRGNGGR